MAEENGELTWRDHAVAFALGVGVAVLAWWSGNSAELPPDLWGEISVACGLRPPQIYGKIAEDQAVFVGAGFGCVHE